MCRGKSHHFYIKQSLIHYKRNRDLNILKRFKNVSKGKTSKNILEHTSSKCTWSLLGFPGVWSRENPGLKDFKLILIENIPATVIHVF
jgi:hypothetical protein